MRYSTAYKSLLWKHTQLKRNNYELRFAALFRSILNRQFKEVADSIDVTNYRSDLLVNKIDKQPIEKLFIELYKVVGVAFAKEQFSQLKAENQSLILKAEDDLTDEWYNYMTSFVKREAGKKIVSIAEQSKKQALKIIRNILKDSTDEGWGADVTATAIKKGLVKDGIEINQWRALRIARTEIVSASNAGAMLGAKSTGFPMEKFWIATYDSRTRDTHLVVEQQNPLGYDDKFKVGEYEMDMPGDASAGAEEIINCRCSIGFGVKNI